MVEEQKPTPSEIEALKKELVEIKRETMRKELGSIKREKMRQELEELKAEQATTGTQRHYEHYTPRLSILTVIIAVLDLLVAGYMLGTLYGFNMAADVDKYLISYNLPISGSLVITLVAIVLALIGLGLVTMAKK